MIEIGKQRIVPVRTRNSDHSLVCVLEADGTVKTKIISDQVWRVTRGILNGRYGRDQGRKLVVGLKEGDLLVFRPQGTQQGVEVSIMDVYQWVLERKATASHMAKLRERKATKERNRVARRLAYAEKRLTRTL